MKIYSYSSELLTFVEAKSVTAKYVIAGILVGTAILFGVIELNQTMSLIPGSRSTNTLTAENNFLRQQVGQMTSQVRKLEINAKQLNEQASSLRVHLQECISAGNKDSSAANLAPKGRPLFIVEK
jgi:hypothetical protein